MQLYLRPPDVPLLLSGGNRLSSLQPVYAWESQYSGVNFNIYCPWAPVSPADNVLSQTLLSAFSSQPGFLSFSCRTKQRPTTRATNTPGSSKPWRPRRTGSDEGRPHPQEGRETETETGNEIGTGARRPHPRQLFPCLWTQAWWREQVRKQTERLVENQQ